mmetsp:Transcript_4187/g.5982  ORF Transcript_4187/g.5982 Transcript_4187/m.5982 type:complete len:86 (-) Transcript_4187:26-283(-)
MTDPLLSKNVWQIYHDDCEQKMGVYPGTPKDDIKDLVRQIYKFPSTQDFYFLDEDGTPIVISAQIPNGTKIFVQLVKEEAKKVVE